MKFGVLLESAQEERQSQLAMTRGYAWQDNWQGQILTSLQSRLHFIVAPKASGFEFGPCYAANGRLDARQLLVEQHMQSHQSLWDKQEARVVAGSEGPFSAARQWVSNVLRPPVNRRQSS